MELTSEFAARVVDQILAGLHREYPNHIVHLLTSDADVRPPRELTPAFYGCFDWHSSVHSHWSLVRLLRTSPGREWEDAARETLAISLTSDNLDAELRYLDQPQRRAFERPYGLAWLLQLTAELEEWDDPQAAQWAGRLRPLAEVAESHLAGWLPQLTHPVRSGEHSQTAFAMGVALDAAGGLRRSAFAELVSKRALEFHATDTAAPLHWEPSGHDFLSPVLAAADLLRRMMAPDHFARWLSGYLPQLTPEVEGWLPPVSVANRSDGKLAHLDGLNLSRAWMLEGIAAGLPEDDERRGVLLKAADEHGRAGVAAAISTEYAGSHWLGSFAVYYLTGRGCKRPVSPEA